LLFSVTNEEDKRMLVAQKHNTRTRDGLWKKSSVVIKEEKQNDYRKENTRKPVGGQNQVLL
jgi:hypothetical protein